jgi:hypothetical protein
MEKFTVNTHHFNAPNTSPITLSNESQSWDSTSVDEIASQILRGLGESIDGSLSDSMPSSVECDHPLYRGSSKITPLDPEDQCKDLLLKNLSMCVDSGPCVSQVLLIVGDSRDFVEPDNASKVRSAGSDTLFLR